MIYSFTISTPANTTEVNAQETTLKLNKGVIHRLEVLFPAGPAGLLHLQIKEGLYQLWPGNSEGNFAEDDNALSFAEYYELFRLPYRLTARTWNLDDTYAHKVTIRIGVMKKNVLLRRLF